MSFVFVLATTMLAAIAAFAPFVGQAQHKKEVVWSADEKPIADQIHGLRALPDDVRAGTTKDLALKIRNLPPTENKLRLAEGLAGLSTEGDFGHDALQEVATTLAETLRERPVHWVQPKADAGASATRQPASPYVELASLVRYEHVEALPFDNDEGQFRAAMARLEADDHQREHPDFTLKDLSGKSWTFSELRGKVVLVNFWATWCPPCRKEMPDLETRSGGGAQPFILHRPGEVLGLVGESGSGKSVTSLAIMGLLPPAASRHGRNHFQNGDGAPTHLTSLPADQLRQLRGSRMAMIFQEPMTALNPVMRVGDQIAEAVLAHHRVSKSEAWRRAVEGMRDVAIPEPEQRARSYPHQLSGGMRQRVMIAMAIVNRPQLLIADEPTTALDVTIQQQILDLLNELRHKFGLAMLFISHDLAVVSHVADRVAVMYAGNLVELGAKADIFRAPAHPYTQGLLRAIPTLATDRTCRSRPSKARSRPSLAPSFAGCPFEPRCALPRRRLRSRTSAAGRSQPGHWARCPVVNPTQEERGQHEERRDEEGQHEADDSMKH
jgi:peptide/nickel transport system ATP-binding protein